MAGIGESSYRRFLLRNEDAIEDFVREYSDALVRFAYSYVHSSAAAEDIVSSALASFFLKGKFFPDALAMRAYLYKTVRSRCVDYLRRHRREVPLEDVENVLGSGDPQEDLLRRERDDALYRSLQRLPGQYCQVLQLMYFDGFAVAQICKILGKNSKQVYNLLARARSALKEILEKEGITYEDLR